MKTPRRCRWFGHKPGVETWPIMACWCLRCGERCDKWGSPMPESTSVADLIQVMTDRSWEDGYNKAVSDALWRKRLRGEDGEVPW